MRFGVALVLLSLALLAAPLAARGAAGRKGPRIGFLFFGSPGPSRELDAFRQGLREHGYIADHWWEPEEFFRVVVAYICSLPSPDDVVTGPQYQRVREPYICGFFTMVLAQHAEVPIRLKLEADR